MPVHEFGIIEDIYNSKIGIEYEPVKYDCISVDDEIIDTIYERLLIVKSYFHSLDRAEFGLAYSGITIILQNHYHYSMMWLFHLTCMKTPMNFMN